MHSFGRCLRRKRDVRSFAQSREPCLLVLGLDLQTETESDFLQLIAQLSHLRQHLIKPISSTSLMSMLECVLTHLVGPSSCVAAATAAA